jgi:membrane protein implicated in regulation of membrane protease activity
MAVITGLVLMVIEAYASSWRYFCEGRGVIVVAKVAVLCMIPWFWSARVFMLAVVVILASIGSHMPRRFRHYSLIEGRVIEN